MIKVSSTRQMTPMPQAPGTEPDPRLRKAARDLEAVFLTMMVKAMEKTIPESPYGGGKNNLAGMMFSTVMGQAMAEQGGMGLAEVLERQLAAREGDPLESLQTPLDVTVWQTLRDMQVSDDD